jgi:hypothetical protein
MKESTKDEIEGSVQEPKGSIKVKAQRMFGIPTRREPYRSVASIVHRLPESPSLAQVPFRAHKARYVPPWRFALGWGAGAYARPALDACFIVLEPEIPKPGELMMSVMAMEANYRARKTGAYSIPPRRVLRARRQHNRQSRCGRHDADLLSSFSYSLSGDFGGVLVNISSHKMA